MSDYDELMENGRRLASERDDLIAAGVDPADLIVPIAPVSRRCRQEMCEHWNGSTCVCAAISGDPDAITALEEWMDDLE